MEDKLAVFLSGYLKRWMEAHYDTLMRTPPALSAMNLGTFPRYLIEAGLYGLMVYVDQVWRADSGLQKLLKETAMDAPPEIGKRLVNGFREKVMAQESAHPGESASSLARRMLLELDPETLGGLLEWIRLRPHEAHEEAAIRELASKKAKELEKLGELSDEVREMMFRLFSPNCQAPVQTEKWFAALEQGITAAQSRASAHLEARRERRGNG